MALSMDEERILTEIASRLSQDDPRLAERLESFGRLRRRSKRDRIIAAVMVAILGVMTVCGAVAAVLYS